MVVPAAPRGWWSRLALPVRVALIVVVILLVASGAYVVYDKVNTCGPEVDWIDEQCIGVTDGSVSLSPDVADVLGKIEQENARVDSSGRAVLSVAYLLGLPAPSSNKALAVTLRHELQGAYFAQRQANLARSEGEEPLLRLLVANDGDRAEHWQQVTAALVDKVDGPAHLVAVIATGQTVDGRQRAIGALTAEGVPLIASRLTGDDLTPAEDDPSPVQGLVRLAPSNSDQAVAAAAYLKGAPGTTRALIVQNTDPSDTYSASLGDAFRRAFPDDTHEVLNRAETYNPQLAGVERTMPDMLVNICYQKPDVIFFAGRSPDLVAFVKALANRPCVGDVPINIVTGSDAVDFVNSVVEGSDELRNGMSANASVRYTALAHPDSWQASPESFAGGASDLFQSTCKECFQVLFRGEPLDDGAAIMGHDAIATAAAAIYTRQGINDKPELIIQNFNRIHEERAVPGASGWISLDENGNPINKAVPILEVKPDGAVVFVQLSSPGRSPDDSPGGSPCRPRDPAAPC